MAKARRNAVAITLEKATKCQGAAFVNTDVPLKTAGKPTTYWSRSLCKVRCCRDSKITIELLLLKTSLWRAGIRRWLLSWRYCKNFSVTPYQNQTLPSKKLRNLVELSKFKHDYRRRKGGLLVYRVAQTLHATVLYLLAESRGCKTRGQSDGNIKPEFWFLSFVKYDWSVGTTAMYCCTRVSGS